jgi:hypothetical protein
VVLSILRHYPQANLIEERLIKDEGDRVYQISHEAYTRLDLVMAYYDPLLKQLGFEQGPDQAWTIEGFPVVYVWYYYGCPYHSIQIAITAGRLLTKYTSGPCR